VLGVARVYRVCERLFLRSSAARGSGARKIIAETHCCCGSIWDESAAFPAALLAAAVLVCSLDLPRRRRQLAAAIAGYLVSACRLRRSRIYSAASRPCGWLRSSTVTPSLRGLSQNRRDRRGSRELWSADTTASTFTSTMQIQ